MSARDVDDLVALHAHPEVSRFVDALDHEEARERLDFDERQWAGRGYGLMAAFRDFDFPYITALIVPDNARSIGVAARIGMTPLRRDKLRDIPVIVHAIDRPTWLASASQPRPHSQPSSYPPL